MMRLSSKIKLRDDGGALREVDLKALEFDDNGKQLTSEQNELVAKLFSDGHTDSFSPTEREKIKSVRARLQSAEIPELAGAILVRFDLKWVSIN